MTIQNSFFIFCLGVGLTTKDPTTPNYDKLGTEANDICSTYLHTRQATKEELEYDMNNRK